MTRVRRWCKGRQGACSLGLTALLLGFRASSGSLTAPTALATLPVVALLVLIAARAWEAKTLPGTPSFARVATPSSSRQLREDTNASIFTDRGGFLFARRYFFVGTGCPPILLSESFAHAVAERRQSEAVLVAYTPARRYWAYQRQYAWENRGLVSRDVMALLHEQARRHARTLEHAHVLLDVAQGRRPGPPRQRQPIPRDVRLAVFSRDGGRCVECSSNFEIQYDHVIPWSMGGADTVENLQLLCSTCNQRKGATL